MRTTIRMKDLAAQLGLSQTTVSHVLSGRHEEFRISRDTVERVQKMAKELGYRSNALAKAFRERLVLDMRLLSLSTAANPQQKDLKRRAEHEN